MWLTWVRRSNNCYGAKLKIQIKYWHFFGEWEEGEGGRERKGIYNRVLLQCPQDKERKEIEDKLEFVKSMGFIAYPLGI